LSTFAKITIKKQKGEFRKNTSTCSIMIKCAWWHLWGGSLNKKVTIRDWRCAANPGSSLLYSAWELGPTLDNNRGPSEYARPLRGELHPYDFGAKVDVRFELLGQSARVLLRRESAELGVRLGLNAQQVRARRHRLTWVLRRRHPCYRAQNRRLERHCHRVRLEEEERQWNRLW
jgi:hypothetical protein